jgi:hypothetical protein
VVEHDTNEGEKVRKLMAELRLFNHFDAARVMAKDQTMHGLQQSVWAEEESLRNKYG